MGQRITIVYNEPVASRYDASGENDAVIGVLDSVKAVEDSLIELGYKTDRLSLQLPTEEAIAKLKSLSTDIVFNLFEGFPGYPETEPIVPAALAELGIPYTGNPAPALAISLNKARSKAVIAAAGVCTPLHQLLNPQNIDNFHLRYPAIVKPCSEDASHGISENSVVYDFEALKRQVNLMANTYGDTSLVEEYIDGREFDATVIGKSKYEVLPLSEITFTLPPGKPKILTFAAKWEPESYYYENTPVICPAKISEEARRRIVEAAVISFRQLGCAGYARVDMRMDKDGNANVIEVNPNPDISLTAGVANQVQCLGMTYTWFIEKIVRIAMEKD